MGSAQTDLRHFFRALLGAGGWAYVKDAPRGESRDPAVSPGLSTYFSAKNLTCKGPLANMILWV